MNNFGKPDYDTGKFGKMFAERFFLDSDFRKSDCIILENVCENYIQRESEEVRSEDQPSMDEIYLFAEDELEDGEWFREEDSECFELVVIRENRVLAAVSVAELPPSWGYEDSSLCEHRRRDCFNQRIRKNFEKMGFTEIEKSSCGWSQKKEVSLSPENLLFAEEMPVKDELRWLKMNDYHRVRNIIVENLSQEKPPEYLIPFRCPEQHLFSDEKDLRKLIREGLIMRENNRIYVTASGKYSGLVTAYRRGKSEVEQVVIAVDNGRQFFDKVKRWELGQQSQSEEIEIFGWKQKRSC
ncbi:MAG: hypothetical protein LUH58_11540 [Lachnospiraceae bacterium]|nr:hypothetical protein [Lachnospiraceae bacterium]